LLPSIGSVVVAAIASVRTGARERSARQAQHETSLIDEEDQVDSLAASAGGAPEPLQDRPRDCGLDVEEIESGL
jgi:hypothetical protein